MVMMVARVLLLGVCVVPGDGLLAGFGGVGTTWKVRKTTEGVGSSRRAVGGVGRVVVSAAGREVDTSGWEYYAAHPMARGAKLGAGACRAVVDELRAQLHS